MRGVSFEVMEGEYVVVLGPIGSGRSTLLKCIAGIVEPDEGDVVIDGVSVLDLPPEERGVGYMPPGYALFPHMTVWDNVAYGLWIKGYSKSEIESRVREVLELVGLLHRARSYPHELSGGMRQRIALARALASGAQLLLLDEPLTALDAILAVEVRHEVRGLVKDLGLTVVHVTHNQEEAMAVADRIVVMRRGRVEQVGAPEEIYFNPRTLFVAKFVSDANLLAGRLVEISNGYGVVEVNGIGPIKVRCRGFREGSRVVVAVRPEAIKLGSGEIAGRVKTVSRLGAFTRIWVSAGDVVLRVDVPTVEALSIGEGDELLLSMPLDAPVFRYPRSGLGGALEQG